LLGGIKKAEGGLPVVDAFKKAYPARGLVEGLRRLGVDKGGQAADYLPLAIFQDPPDAGAIAEQFVFFGAEDFLDILIQRPDKIRIILIKIKGQPDKGFNRLG
jgi:hypothetical protein